MVPKSPDEMIQKHLKRNSAKSEKCDIHELHGVGMKVGLTPWIIHLVSEAVGSKISQQSTFLAISQLARQCDVPPE